MLNGTYLLSKVWIRDNYDNYVHFYPADPEYPTLATLAALTLMLSILPQLRRILNRSQFPSRPLFSSPSALRRLFAPTVMPAKALPKWTWLSADTSIAEVVISKNSKFCTITGVTPGTTIIGTTQNALTASCEVTVTDAPLPENGTANELYRVGVGGYVDIVPALTPAADTTLYEVTLDTPHVAGGGRTIGHTGVRIEGNNPRTATSTIRGANNLVMTTMVKVGTNSDRQHEKNDCCRIRTDLH